MNTFIIPNDIEDELLRGIIQTSDLEAASKYILKVATALGVLAEEIPLEPVPQEVIDLCCAFACGRRAKFASGLGTKLDGNGVDEYEIKRRVYAKEVQTMTFELTPAMLRGSVSTVTADYDDTITLERG